MSGDLKGSLMHNGILSNHCCLNFQSESADRTPNLRKVLNTIVYVEITGCRWCDVPSGKQWAKRSTAHEWLGLLEEYIWERIKNGILCMADLAKTIDWKKGALDGSFPPGKAVVKA